jgi:23S rRNA (uracil1939-C5)-methyltransferase
MISDKKEIIVNFEKIGHNGVTIGRFNNKIVFTYGVLPFERARIRVYQERKNFIKGEPIEIIEPSSFRIKPREDHYLSCSPWQVFDYHYQVLEKKKILTNIFNDFLKEEILLDEFFEAPNKFFYRTKIEYSFLKEDKYYFAFFKRESYREKIKVDRGCFLIDQQANEIAQDVLDCLNKLKVKDLKSLIIRKSFSFKNDYHISLLTFNKKNILNISKFDRLNKFVFAYSNEKSPVSRFDKVLFSYGDEYLREKIHDLEIRYHCASFFQNNIELFEKVIEKIKENCVNFNKIVDLYCGVGVIGLSLNKMAKKIIGVEIDKLAVDYAKINSRLNNIDNFKIFNIPSEKIDFDFLENVDALVLDPPRSGVHKRVIETILKTKPYKIFYLSCNPLTQARDISYLKNFYLIEKIYAFDFYPQTPHLECLVILRRR